ncbi:MAG: hypothetical protein Q4F97_09395 [Bacteroidales bacterium]|nr:hypothetical protein [Bacteroidales bacterium]
MKKKLVIFICFAICAASSIKAQYYHIDNLKLNKAYEALVKASESKEAEKNFFNAFPNTWGEFIVTYQFTNLDDDLTMYNNSYNHINAFGKLKTIADSIYFKKLINLSIGAEFWADAPNYLQSLLHKKMTSNGDDIMKSLKTLRKGYQLQFWQFYWSKSVKDEATEQEYNDLIKKFIDVYPNQISYIKDGYKYFYNGVNIDGGYLEE